MVLIMQVCCNKLTGQKYITIPQKYKNILSGDYVKIIKIEED